MIRWRMMPCTRKHLPVMIQCDPSVLAVSPIGQAPAYLLQEIMPSSAPFLPARRLVFYRPPAPSPLGDAASADTLLGEEDTQRDPSGT